MAATNPISSTTAPTGALLQVVNGVLTQETCDVYCKGLYALKQADVPFLVGGAYAFGRYTGIERHTKDLDIFVRPEDVDRAFTVLRRAGFRTQLTFPHWLGKAFRGEDFIDVIFSAGNGVARVDDEWFEHAVDGLVFGIPVKLCPVEEMIWSKAFVQERERFDGADIAHLLRSCARNLDWHRLLRRFGDNWRVLFSHLVMFGFIYPAERTTIPARVLRQLTDRLHTESARPPSEDDLCRGTLVSRAQYLVDVDQWHYRDGRLQPNGNMSQQDIDTWTAAIDTGN